MKRLNIDLQRTFRTGGPEVKVQSRRQRSNMKMRPVWARRSKCAGSDPFVPRIHNLTGKFTVFRSTGGVFHIHEHLKASPWIRTWINKLVEVCFSAAREAHFFDLVAPQRKHSVLQELALRQWSTFFTFPDILEFKEIFGATNLLKTLRRSGRFNVPTNALTRPPSSPQEPGILSFFPVSQQERTKRPCP